MENWREERTGAYTSPHFCVAEIGERRFFAQACACIKIGEGQLSKYCCANNTTVGWAYMPNKIQQPLMSCWIYFSISMGLTKQQPYLSCWARLSISTRLTSPVNIQFSLSLRNCVSRCCWCWLCEGKDKQSNTTKPSLRSEAIFDCTGGKT